MASKFRVDLTNYKDRMGSRVPPGTYKVVIDDIEEAQTRDDRPMLNVFLRVADGSEWDGSTLLDRLLPTHEKALFRVVNFLQALGFKTPRKTLEFDLDKIVGRTVEVEVEDGDPYMGKVKSEVRTYQRAEQAPQRDLDDLDEEPEKKEEESTSDESVDLDTVDL